MSSSIINFAKSSNAVETGFVAAGITVSILAIAQSLFAVLSWLIFGG
jgi:hypothetical protein